jgi:hypothetical protein
VSVMVLGVEYRREWPGGIAVDEHGHLRFTASPADPDPHPVWSCSLCRRAVLHTWAEHCLLACLDLAPHPGPPPPRAPEGWELMRP